jgi:hypothetical protein
MAHGISLNFYSVVILCAEYVVHLALYDTVTLSALICTFSIFSILMEDGHDTDMDKDMDMSMKMDTDRTLTYKRIQIMTVTEFCHRFNQYQWFVIFLPPTGMLLEVSSRSWLS